MHSSAIKLPATTSSSALIAFVNFSRQITFVRASVCEACVQREQFGQQGFTFLRLVSDIWIRLMPPFGLAAAEVKNHKLEV